ncbi:hypothetical protein D3C73_1461780 [compost metagenome]
MLEEARDNDLFYVKEKANSLVKLEDITILSSNDKRYIVAASIKKIVENDLDMFDLPFSKAT